MNNEALSKKVNPGNPWENFSMREMPTTSRDRTCDLYINFINQLGRMDNVAHFIDKKLGADAKKYDSWDEFRTDDPNYTNELDSRLSFREKGALREYSGYNFTSINSYSRGFWDYDKMGKRTDEKVEELQETIELIRSAFEKTSGTKDDFMTFRGTNLDGFRSYGVENISDLEKMEGQLYVEKGFTSTALSREKSFADRDVSGLRIGASNIEVRYHIPAECKEVIPLSNHDLSYNPEQTEVLINKGALSYISDVNIEGDRAKIDMLLIPREVYDSIE